MRVFTWLTPAPNSPSLPHTAQNLWYCWLLGLIGELWHGKQSACQNWLYGWRFSYIHQNIRQIFHQTAVPEVSHANAQTLL